MVYSRGQFIFSDGSCITVTEDFFPDALPSDPESKIHVDQIDNDLDGLIDENQPNHLNKATFINNIEAIVALRHINYMNFEVGDTIQQGLIVPNQIIRDRINNDINFNRSIIDYQNQLRLVFGDNYSNQFYSNYFKE